MKHDEMKSEVPSTRAAELLEKELKPLEFTTEFSELDMVCRQCQGTWQAPIIRRVNVETDPDARLGILMKTVHHSRCPACHWETPVETTFEYYDPAQNLIVQIRPPWEYKAGGGEDWFLKRFEALVHKYADYDVRVDVVFSLDEMIEKHLGGEPAVEQAKAEYKARNEAERAEREAKAAWRAEMKAKRAKEKEDSVDKA